MPLCYTRFCLWTNLQQSMKNSHRHCGSFCVSQSLVLCSAVYSLPYCAHTRRKRKSNSKSLIKEKMTFSCNGCKIKACGKSLLNFVLRKISVGFARRLRHSGRCFTGCIVIRLLRLFGCSRMRDL
jgi:hypothetical protein